jgi:hypothetical protein
MLVTQCKILCTLCLNVCKNYNQVGGSKSLTVQQNCKNMCALGTKYSAVQFVALRSRRSMVCEEKQLSWNVQLCLCPLMHKCINHYQ